MSNLANYMKVIVKKEDTPYAITTPTNILPFVKVEIDTTVNTTLLKEATGSNESVEAVKGKQNTKWNISLNASVSKIWMLLNSMFWNPVNTDLGNWKYSHLFDKENKEGKTYTLDCQDSKYNNRFIWTKFDNLNLSLSENSFQVTADIFAVKTIEQEKIKEVDEENNLITLYQEIELQTWDKIAIFNPKWENTETMLSILSVNWTQIELEDVSNILAGYSLALEKVEDWISNTEISKPLLACKTNLYLNQDADKVKIDKVIDYSLTISRNIWDGDDNYLGSCHREEITSRNLTTEGNIKISINSDQYNKFLSENKVGWELYLTTEIEDSLENKLTREESIIITQIKKTKNVWEMVEVDITFLGLKTEKIELIDTVSEY